MKVRRRVSYAFTVTLIAFTGLWVSGILSPYYFAAVTAGPGNGRPRILSPDLKVDIEARPIEGLTQNVSGLTYSNVTSTLFAVVNRPPMIAELSTDGRLLRRIPFEGLKDPEGITHMDGTRFLIADEGDQSLYIVSIGPLTTKLVVGSRPALVLGFDFKDNMGFEGASWDSNSKRLYLAQEMMPTRVLTIDGLDPPKDGTPQSIVVKSWGQPWLHRSALIDISSISINEASGNLLLLSHMSRMMLEYTKEGRLVGALPLNADGLGLIRSIAQAEGITIKSNGQIFLVAEPNLFFRFSASNN